MQQTKFFNVATGAQVEEFVGNGTFEMVPDPSFDSRYEFDVFVTPGAVLPVGATITPAFRVNDDDTPLPIPDATPLTVNLPAATSVQVMPDSFRTGARFCLTVSGMSAGSIRPKVVQ